MTKKMDHDVTASKSACSAFSFPVLIGDIGGTNARFALVKKPGAPYQEVTSLKVQDFDNAVDAIGAVLEHYTNKPASAFFAVAAPVDNIRPELTNADWILDADEIGKIHGFRQIALINDFPPVAASLPSLVADRDMFSLGHAASSGKTGTKLVIGVGTGCGASALIPVGDRLLLQPTEIGHTSLGPEGLLQHSLWPFLITDDAPQISVETLLSGQGLLRLYQGLQHLDNDNHSGGSPATPAGVLDALSKDDPIAHSTIEVFTSLLARIAGDLALLFQAHGGVYIGGGVVPRLLNVLDSCAFRYDFENRPPLQGYLRAIPTYVITHENPALSGLAALVSDPQRFIAPSVFWLSGR